MKVTGKATFEIIRGGKKKDSDKKKTEPKDKKR